MKHLFTEHDRYSDDAMRLSNEARRAVQGLFRASVTAGHSAREIAAVMKETINELMLEEIIDPNSKTNTGS